MKKIVLVGQMMASTNGFKPLEQELKKRGYNVQTYLPAGKSLHDVAEKIFENAGSCDLVLTGMSSEQNLVQEEVKSLEIAIARNIPCGLYSDTFGTHRRTWFKHLREKINFLFVTNEEEKKDAETIYPNTKIIVSGNPSHEAYFNPVWTYKQSREILGIAPDEKIILCPQVKNLEVNREFIGVVIRALDAVWGRKFRLFICLHPSDLNPMESYCDFLKPREASSVNVALITKNIMRSSVLVPASDIIIESGSAIGAEGCCQRKPVISFWSRIAVEREIAQKGVFRLPLCDLGTERAVYGDISELALEISSLLSEEGYAPMRKKQEEVFPRPTEKGSAVRIMADTIEKYLS